MPDDVTGALLHQEVRGALSKMSLSEKNKALGLAVSSGDESFLAAATGASPTLSGLTLDQQKSFRDRWRRARHGEDAAKIAALTNGVAQLTRVREIFTKWSSSLVEELPAATVVAAEESAAKAARAAS
jgi:hypothetical protein